MADANTSSKNWVPLFALLLSIAAFMSNFAVFLRPPGERAIPLISLVLAGVALVLLIAGVRRAFAQNRGKILSSILAVVTLLLCGVTGFAYFGARQLPRSAGAPKIGEKAPDFTLMDSTGKPVSLAQLLGSAPSASSAKPKAVLLIFYRGYW
jgi:O-antigen ligase